MNISALKKIISENIQDNSYISSPDTLMMTRNFLLQGKRLILSMLILGFGSGILSAQKTLSGNLNQPSTHVVTIGADRVVVDNVTGFAANDTILLIQMKGAKILTAGSSYGAFQDKLGEPGMHEFMIILSVNSGTKEIVFRNNFLNTYDPRGDIQIVRTPYYNSAIVTGKLFCAQWDTLKKSGGVLALIVGRTITLNADIDVSGLGFKGGSDAIGNGICRSTNNGLYGLEFYPGSFPNAGYKGEGVANYTEFNQLLGINYMKGQGYNWTGGGGGNGRYSGGGGGSNRGKGGDGGNEDALGCSSPLVVWNGGWGAVVADHPSVLNRIYMGGGGGSSTNSPTGNSSFGGNGGGVVIIVADGIVGGGGNILANGNPGGTVNGAGGSGGGGAGGSIALSLNSYGSNDLNFSATGGTGGFNSGNTNGEGGGGGGGLVYLRTPLTPKITTTLDGGSSAGHPGDNGEPRPNFKANLNGFLFNSISSFISGNQVDYVCSNMIPPKIIGTTPVGGTSPYTYLWEKSYDQITWIPLTNDTDPINYTPSSMEPATVWFRRTVTSSSPSSLVDISKPVQIIVQPAISGNLVGSDNTICFNQDPISLIPLNSGPSGGSGIYQYKWIQNTVDNNWNTAPDATGNSTLPAYDPPPLAATTFYQRIVTSGKCVDFSSTVKITVLPAIVNNSILSADQNICYGTAFANLTATTPTVLSGGDDIFHYKWESNINGSGWTTAPGANTGPGYNPTELPQKIPYNEYIFRRVVTSGLNDVCSSTSNTVDLKDYSRIINNTVASVAAVCYDFSPAPLVGSKTPALSGADGIYTFSWQQSLNSTNWADTTGPTGADLQPTKLDKTTWYRRIVKSPVTGCADSSAAVKIDVHPTILNNAISLSTGGTNQTICNNQVPVSFLGQAPSGGFGGYGYQWMYSTDGATFTPVPTGSTLPNYSSAALTTSTWFRRDVISGACSSVSNQIPITVLPLIANNTISGTSRVCYSRVPDPVTGSSLTGGSGSYSYLWQESTDGSIWNPASGTNNSPTYQPPVLFNPIKYRRTAASGPNDCCSSISNVFDIAVDPLPASPINAGPDTVIFSFENIYHMKATPLNVAGETGLWSLLDNGTSTIKDPASYNSKIEKLARGKNSFMWTVTKGNCDLKDSVSIELLKNFIPKAFSPNGDAWNNTFIIEGLDPEDNYLDLSIVNGAGTEVFSTTNRNGQEFENWDGKNSKGLDLSEGTYYYMLKITPKVGTGTAPPQSGFIILKRY
jgi:hypothetical protein